MNVSGKYKVNSWIVDITLDGDTVNGVYYKKESDTDKGNLSCTLEGDLYKGTYKDPNGTEGVMHLSFNENGFDGKWGKGLDTSSPRGAWNGTKIEDGGSDMNTDSSDSNEFDEHKDLINELSNIDSDTRLSELLDYIDYEFPLYDRSIEELKELIETLLNPIGEWMMENEYMNPDMFVNIEEKSISAIWENIKEHTGVFKFDSKEDWSNDGGDSDEYYDIEAAEVTSLGYITDWLDDQEKLIEVISYYTEYYKERLG